MYTEREGDLTYFSNEGKGKSLILINLIQCYQILLIRAFSIFLLTLLPTQFVSMQLINKPPATGWRVEVPR